MNVENIGSQKAYEMLQQEDHGIVVLDVRTAKEFNEGHIANAVNIDFKEEDFVQKMDALDKSKTYIMHCRSGGRSTNALSSIQDLHFQKIYHINGGMLEWQEQKLPLSK